jgi:fumarate hydratase, class II
VARSLTIVMALSSIIGYDEASKIARSALDKEITLKAAALELGYVDDAEFDGVIDPAKMVTPYIEEGAHDSVRAIVDGR